jgi:hypothetical protein
MTTKDLEVVVRGVAPIIKEYVAADTATLTARLEALEAKMLTVKDGRDGKDGERGDAGPPGPPGLAGERGPAGAEGAAGRDGRDGLPGVPGAMGAKGLDGTNGLHGKDGADGLGFDDLAVEFDGDRTLSLKFMRGDKLKVFALPLPFLKYQGVFQHGKAYDPGDTVSFGSHLWHCNEATVVAPGESVKAWTLCVKKGRDGKDGRDAPGALPVVSVGKR